MKIAKNRESRTARGKATSLRTWIKLNLAPKGFTIQSFAEKHGVKAGSVGVVFSRPYPRMERLIAHTLELAPQEILPSRYDENGKPNRPNLWHRRGTGGWRPKISRKNLRVKEKNFG
jgi:lambda repressor-like predicted transcriptional regulator